MRALPDRTLSPRRRFFYSDYKNFQARVGGGTIAITGGSFPVDNAGKPESTELSGDTVYPTRDCSINAALGYPNAEYKEFDTPGAHPPPRAIRPVREHLRARLWAASLLFAGQRLCDPVGGAGSMTLAAT